jgi:hypothetical protein
LWSIIKADSSLDLAETVEQNLARLYFGEQYYNASNLPMPQRQPAIDAAKSHLGGPELQRLIAMALLLSVAPEDTASAARALLDDPAISPALRLDSLQILLLSRPTKEAETIAIKHMNDANLRQAALPYLAGGSTHIRILRGSFSLTYVSVAEYAADSQSIVVAPPKGLEIEPVRRAMAAGDERTKAYAGYLLVLLGERSGLDPLLAYYRAQPRRPYDDQWAQLVYRAITFVNDPALVPTLEEIYSGYDKSDTWRIRTFYWTIRTMTGDQVLALRKKIRDEVGMERLR